MRRPSGPHVPEVARPIASGSGTSKHSRPSLLSADNLDDKFSPPFRLPSRSPTSKHSPSTNKGKNRVRFDDQYTTVRFGPLEIADDPEDIFDPIFEGLQQVVRKDVLVHPAIVEQHDCSHLAIRFTSVVNANNFAMTWMFHRFEPYKDISAILIDTE